MTSGQGGNMYYIGIDLGTSAVKLLLMEEDGTIKKIVNREYPIAFPLWTFTVNRCKDTFDLAKI